MEADLRIIQNEDMIRRYDRQARRRCWLVPTALRLLLHYKD